MIQDADDSHSRHTDVLVIALHVYWDVNVIELWIEFGTGKDRRWVPVHSYAELLGERVWWVVIFWYAMTGCDRVSNQLHGKRGRLYGKWQILLSNYHCLEKSKPNISEFLKIWSSSCMTGFVRTRLLTNAASIYLHRWIKQWTTTQLHQMLCCSKFAGKCHSQTYGLVAWHWMNQIKTWQIRVGLWMTKARSSQYGKHYQKHHMHRKNRITAPVEGFVSRTIVHAKTTTFRVQIYASVKDNVKTRLI